MKTREKINLSTGIFFPILFFSFLAWGQGGVEHLKFPLAEKKCLYIEVLSDTLIHFYVENDTVPNSKISPYVIQNVFSGPTFLKANPSGIETSLFSINIVNAKCLSIYDKNQNIYLTQMCVEDASLTLTPEATKNIYGLGEVFRVPGEVNGDFFGQVRESGKSNGNALMAFEGGAVANALFPISYFLGKGLSNYALFLDNSSPQKWDFKNQPWQISPSGGSLSWYLIGGANLKSLRKQFMDLVGHPLVPPKKTLGLWVSEFGYRNWNIIREKLKSLRSNHFPIDGFMLDLYWFGSFNSTSNSNNFGKLQWDLASFPNPKNQIDYFKNHEGLGIGIIEEPYINSNLPEYTDLASHEFLVKSCENCRPLTLRNWWGSGAMVDYTNPKAGAYVHDFKRKFLDHDGVMIHWTDLGEPEESGPNSWYEGGGLGHDEITNHNLYNLRWAQSIYDGFIRNHRTTRPFILTRSGGPGIERFGAALWSGDIGSNMESLASHLNAQMHLSLSGIDYFGSDIGGFHRQGLHGDLKDVYTRWFAHSSLFDLPVRPHTDNNETAPDHIGDLQSNLFNIRQRYELSPYYYNLAHLAYLNADPVVPPLTYYFQEDENVRTLADEKMIGPELLAATAPRLNERERDVYLPQGNWMNYHDHTWFHSKGEWFKNISEYDGTILRLPLFVRDGSILPVMKVDNNTMDVSGKRLDGSQDSNLYLKISISKSSPRSSQFTLFEDDGETTDYKTSATARTFINFTQSGPKILLSIFPQEGKFLNAPSLRRSILELNLENPKISEVKLNDILLIHRKNSEELEKNDTGWTEIKGYGIRIKLPALPVSEKKNLELKSARL